MATKIILDPGHGGYDAGASFEGRKEKDDVLNLAFDVADELRRLGYEVEFTRTDDVYDSPTEKARIGNASGADFFISLHRNSSPTPNQYEGVETLLYSDTGTKAEMARNINSNLAALGFKDLGVEVRKDLAVLRRTKMPALLLEVGFINNEYDNQLFDTKRAEIAEAIAKGIDETLRAGTTTAVSNTSFVNSYHGYETDMPIFADERMPEQDMNDMNNLMGGSQGIPPEQIIYQILVSIFRNLGMASFKMNQLLNSGFDATANEVDGLYQVRVGAFETIEEALKVQEQLRNRGYDTLIVTSQTGEVR